MPVLTDEMARSDTNAISGKTPTLSRGIGSIFSRLAARLVNNMSQEEVFVIHQTVHLKAVYRSYPASLFCHGWTHFSKDHGAFNNRVLASVELSYGVFI